MLPAFIGYFILGILGRLRGHDHFDEPVSEEMVGQHTIGTDRLIRFGHMAVPCLNPGPDMTPSLRIVSRDGIEGDQAVVVGDGGVSDFHQ
ncbi:hypothetical protein [Ensifer sp. LC163]|uniref:hypothetical protein n=1 Tax=Ensifer sp. LC163 TaxID=1120652 RepID=UPI00081E1FC2|nr:hypothetical protein [Ensifer sp. LC163]OCP38656.1 hypothetical protein BC360_00880 [Ensifer sp. LC163]